MFLVVSRLAGGLFSMEMSSSSLREKGKAGDRVWLSSSGDIMTTEEVSKGRATYTPSGRSQERKEAV